MEIRLINADYRNKETSPCRAETAKKTVFFSQNNQKYLQTPGAPTPEPAAGKPARNKEQNSLGRSAGGLCL